MTRSSILVVTIYPLLASGLLQTVCLAQASQPTVLPGIIVTGSNPPLSLTSPSEEEASLQNDEVPGGFTLRNAKQMERGRGSNFQDLLEGVPGLTLQSENGMEVSKVSIRGSAVLSEDEPLGVQFLLDGFTFNQGDGEVILEDFDFGAIQYAEVFRGANAFKYGALGLGGAVNLVSRTGYGSDPFQIRLEGGSYGFFRGQASAGGVEGPLDYFASVTGRLRDGYREHSRENTEDLFTNFGYKFNDHLENRVYLTLARTERSLPGGITKEQMNDDPRQVDPEYIEQNLSKAWTYLRLADKLSFTSGGQQADVGGYWWHRNLYERGLFTADSPEGIQQYYSDNYGILLDAITRFELFGQQNIFTIGFAPTFEREVDANFQNLSGLKGAETARDAELSVNAPLYAEDQQYLTDNLSVLAGLQAIYVQRRFSDSFNNTPSGNQTRNQIFRTLNPKIGAIYKLDEKGQIYANLSRSWQPPSFDNEVDFGDDPGDSLEVTPLQPQRAWTVEIGTRGERGRFEWELSLYRSWLRDELLDVNNVAGVDRGAVNIRRSLHQGIEAGLDIELLNSILFKGDKDGSGDRLLLTQSYTLNDLRFDGDPVYHNNRIGGIPIHFYQAELRYEGPRGFYAGPNLQWNITRYPVDHANTLSADAYLLLGFKCGFQSRKGFSIFFEAKNLTDERYPAAVDPIPDARTVDGPIEVFHPGDGRSFYGGMSWTF
ncbi:MAG TPA: TonB-dependent receptor [Chthoniobacterales bacterium]